MCVCVCVCVYIYVHTSMYLHILQARLNLKQNIENSTRRPECVLFYCQRHILRNNMEKEWLCFRGTFSVLLTLLTATGVRQQYNGKHFYGNNIYVKAPQCYLRHTSSTLF